MLMVPAARSSSRKERCMFNLGRLGCVIVLSLVALGATAPVRAAEKVAHDAAQFDTILRQSGAGDTIVLASGTWTDAALVIDRGGRADAPLTIRAGKPGAVTFSGHSSLQFKEPHVIVQGILFQNG